MGVAILLVLVLVEAVFLFWCLKTHNRHTQEKAVVRIAEFVLLLILLATGVLEWGFRYYAILIVLGIQVMLGVVVLARKKEKPYTPGKSFGTFFRNSILYIFAVFLAILCPQYTPPAATGSYAVATASYVWEDTTRVETFTSTGENRVVNVDFWYPEEAGEYPLVVFSHGAFGFSGSNHSTFMQLASNGYVVASIGHPYHAFVAQGANGKTILANADFINSVYAVNNMEDGPEKQKITDGWMELRLADVNFVLDTITEQVNNGLAEGPFGSIALDKIGLMGHSLGGAAMAQIGRERQDVDAVIVLDGTMLGEVVGYENGAEVLNDTPYPIPLLNVYAQNHYDTALPYGELYQNFYAANHAVDSHEVVMEGAGHLNFTDLPLFSPLLAEMLGVGTIDARQGIETTNAIVLEFFNYALKGGPLPQF